MDKQIVIAKFIGQSHWIKKGYKAKLAIYRHSFVERYILGLGQLCVFKVVRGRNIFVSNYKNMESFDKDWRIV